MLDEDFSFCECACRCGFRVMADTTIRLWRVGLYRFGWEDAGRDVERFTDYTFEVAERHEHQLEDRRPPAPRGEVQTPPAPERGGEAKDADQPPRTPCMRPFGRCRLRFRALRLLLFLRGQPAESAVNAGRLSPQRLG